MPDFCCEQFAAAIKCVAPGVGFELLSDGWRIYDMDGDSSIAIDMKFCPFCGKQVSSQPPSNPANDFDANLARARANVKALDEHDGYKERSLVTIIAALESPRLRPG